MQEVKAGIAVNQHEAQPLGAEEGFGFRSLAVESSGSMLAKNIGVDRAEDITGGEESARV
jgi:hypothetical protein